ncbi:MAG: hypothetical protein QW204_02920 [Thermoplasmata archaeon]
MSEIFIIDEWLWANLDGKNGEKKQRETFIFLEKLYLKCDKIAVASGSKFEKKAWNFCKAASSCQEKRKIARFFAAVLMYNSSKYLQYEIEHSPLGMDGVKEDDAYLVKLHKETGARIITTDRKLKEALQTKNIPCELRDEFLAAYL